MVVMLIVVVVMMVLMPIQTMTKMYTFFYKKREAEIRQKLFKKHGQIEFQAKT